MDYLNHEQIEQIKKYGLFTGSRCFNIAVHKNSDFDFVLLKDDFERIIDLEKDPSRKDFFDQYHKNEDYCEDETNFVAFKYFYKGPDGKKYAIDLIVVDHQVTFDAWRFATNSFKANDYLLKKLGIEENQKIKDIVKLMFESIKYSYIQTNRIVESRARNKQPKSRPIGKPRLWNLL